MSTHSPPNLVTFGPNANCTLELCDVSWSVFAYRPSLIANVAFVALFGVLGAVHAYLGFRWKSWGFMGGMLLGCVFEIIGYCGRIMMWDNPFSFIAFMLQIMCITTAPVFFTASIYVTLSKTINYLDRSLSRFNPVFFYWIFIPFDILCLILQGAGGAMSTTSNGGSDLGVDISMAGLVLQVIILFAFVVCFADYMIRYLRSDRTTQFTWRLKAFFVGLAASIVLILARCAYRVAELKDGYEGEMIKEEIPFIVLEGVLIVLATLALCFGHPGLVMKQAVGFEDPKNDEENNSCLYEMIPISR